MAIQSSSTKFEDPAKGKTPENGGKSVTDKARDMASNVADKARETASNVADKARETAFNVADRAKDAASSLGQKAEDATHAVGSGMQSLAGTMRDKLPQSGPLGAATSTLAGGLESTGRYLQEEGLKGVADDITNLIRRNPLPAMFLGIGLGFILARATSRS
jgi:hypothetical protein